MNASAPHHARLPRSRPDLRPPASDAEARLNRAIAHLLRYAPKHRRAALAAHCQTATTAWASEIAERALELAGILAAEPIDDLDLPAAGLSIYIDGGDTDIN